MNNNALELTKTKKKLFALIKTLQFVADNVGWSVLFNISSSQHVSTIFDVIAGIVKKSQCQLCAQLYNGQRLSS